MKNVIKRGILLIIATLCLFALLPLGFSANDTTGMCANIDTTDPDLIVCDDFTNGLINTAWTNTSTGPGYVKFESNSIKMKGAGLWDLNILRYNSVMPRENVTYGWNCTSLTAGNVYTTLGTRSEYTNGLIGLYRNTGENVFCQALNTGSCVDYYTNVLSTTPNYFLMQIDGLSTYGFNVTLRNNNTLQSNGTVSDSVTTKKFQWNVYSGEIACYGFIAWKGDIANEPNGTLNIDFTYPNENQVLATYRGDLNFTVSANTINCTINSTEWTLDTKTATSYNYVNTTGFNGGYHSVNATCEPVVGNNISKILTFNIDDIKPVFTSTIQNNISDYSYNITYNINITDPNPNNYTLVDSCGNTDSGTISANPHNYNISFHLNGCAFGTQYTNFSVCDTVGNCQFETYQWNLKNNLRVRTFDTLGVLLTNFTVWRDGVLLGNTTSSIFDVGGLNNSIYNISVLSPGFSLQSVLYNSSGTHQEYNFSLYLKNTFNIIFREEVTETLIDNTLITVQFISDSFGSNYTTPNGTLLVSLLTPDIYTIRSSATGYHTGFKTVQLTNNSLQNFTIYMSNATTHTEVTATVIDEFGDRVEGAYIESLRYDTDTNTYKSIEVVQTNFDGQAELNLEKNTEFYKFIIYYPFGTAKLTTTPTQIFGNTLTFQINLGTIAGSEFFTWNNLQYSLYFGNTTNTFTYTFTDLSNSVSQGCLDVHKIVKTRITQINESCVSGSSGSINILISPQNGSTFVARAYITTDTQYLVEEKVVSYGLTSQSGKLGLFLVMILIILFSFSAYWNKTIALIITPVPMVLASITGIWDVSIVYSGCIWIIAMVLAMYINRGGQ